MTDRDYIGYKAHNLGFDAHLTVMYTGKLTGEQAQRIDEILVFDEISDYGFHIKPTGFAMFGPTNNITVLTVEVPNEVWQLRHRLERHPDIPNPSEYGFNPHITLPKFPLETSFTIPNLVNINGLGLHA